MVILIETVYSAQLILELFYSVVLHLYELSAFPADEMVVMFESQLRLISFRTVFEPQFFSQSRLAEKMQGLVRFRVAELKFLLRI